MEDWYILDGERRDGPYPTELMQAMRQVGELSPDQLVQQGYSGTPILVKEASLLQQPPLDELTAAASETPRIADQSPQDSRERFSRWFRILSVGGIVGLFVILPLLALVVPLVTHMRERARQTQCQDHFRESTIAIFRHQETHGAYPSGWRAVEPLRSNYSWGRDILAERNQSTLATSLAAGPASLAEALTDPSLAVILSTSMTGSHCPSNEFYPINEQRPVLDRADGEHRLTTSSYVANHGVGPWSRGDRINGLFGEDSNITTDDLTDGDGVTIMLGERSFELFIEGKRLEGNGALWFGLNGDGSVMRQSDVLAVGDGGINGRLSTRSTPTDATIGYSSLHPGGAQFGYADGRTAMLNENIDEGVFYRLLRRDDGAGSH